MKTYSLELQRKENGTIFKYPDTFRCRQAAIKEAKSWDRFFGKNPEKIPDNITRIWIATVK